MGLSLTVSEIDGDFSWKSQIIQPPCILHPRWRGSPWNWIFAVMWSETVGLRTRPIWDKKKTGLGLGLAGLVLFCETRSCDAHCHNDLEGHSNFSSTINSFSILYLEHHYCGDQQCLKVKSAKCLCLLPVVLVLVLLLWSWSCKQRSWS